MGLDWKSLVFNRQIFFFVIISKWKKHGTQAKQAILTLKRNKKQATTEDYMYNSWKQSFLFQFILQYIQLKAPAVCWWAPQRRSGNHSWGRPCMDKSEAHTPARQWPYHFHGELPLLHTGRGNRKRKICVYPPTLHWISCENLVHLSVFTGSSNHQ